MRFALLSLLVLALPAWPQETLRVAVAANFKPTLAAINTLFERQTGHRVLLSSASTGVLYSQITQGAPFDIFFSADRETAQRLENAGTGSAAFCYAVGRLVLVGGELARLADPNSSLAIGNPASAPYGRAALEVLQRNQFKAGAARKLVRGNNVAQAYQFWYSKAVELALIPRSLAPGAAAVIPGQWHAALAQYAVVLQPGAALDAYLKWIRSDTVRTLINEAGYEPCP